MWSEFRSFINRGNVLELAVAVIIGTAFGKIIGSLVEDILMPVISSVFSVSIPDVKIIIKESITGADGKVITPGIAVEVGKFIQSIIDFILVSIPIFFVVKVMNKLKRSSPPPPPAPPNTTEMLLAEIRDLLKK